MSKGNKEIIEFAKRKTAEAINSVNAQQIVLHSLKHYEMYRHVYSKNPEWTIEKIADVLSSNALKSLELISSEDGNAFPYTESKCNKQNVSSQRELLKAFSEKDMDNAYDKGFKDGVNSYNNIP